MMRDKILLSEDWSVSCSIPISILTFPFPQFGQTSSQMFIMVVFISVVTLLAVLDWTGKKIFLISWIIIFMATAPENCLPPRTESLIRESATKNTVKVSELHFPRNCYQKRSNDQMGKRDFQGWHICLCGGAFRWGGGLGTISWLRGRICHLFSGADEGYF